MAKPERYTSPSRQPFFWFVFIEILRFTVEMSQCLQPYQDLCGNSVIPHGFLGQGHRSPACKRHPQRECLVPTRWQLALTFLLHHPGTAADLSLGRCLITTGRPLTSAHCLPKVSIPLPQCTAAGFRGCCSGHLLASSSVEDSGLFKANLGGGDPSFNECKRINHHKHPVNRLVPVWTQAVLSVLVLQGLSA